LWSQKSDRPNPNTKHWKIWADLRSYRQGKFDPVIGRDDEIRRTPNSSAAPRITQQR